MRPLLILAVFAALLCAASAQTPVSSCQTLGASGTYALTQNLASTPTCINITASNVVLDCVGYKITGTRSNDGIYISSPTNVSVRNCTILSYYQAILAYSSSSLSLSDITAYNSTSDSIELDYTNNSALSRIALYNNSARGITLLYANNDSLSNITALNHTGNAVHLTYSNNNSISGVFVNKSAYGVLFDTSNNNSCSDVLTFSSTYGIYTMYSSSNNRVSNATLLNDSTAGVWDISDTGNNTYSNIRTCNNTASGYGIYMNSPNARIYNATACGSQYGLSLYYLNTPVTQPLVSNLTSYDNSFGVLVYMTVGATLSNVTVYNNSDTGIRISYANSTNLSNALVYKNNMGIFVRYSNNSSIINVTAYNNSFGAHFLYSWNNVLSSGAMSNNSYGVQFNFSLNNILSGVNSTNNSNYGFSLLNSSSNSISNSYACPNAIGGYFFASTSNSNSGSANYGNITDNDSNSAFSSSPCGGPSAQPAVSLNSPTNSTNLSNSSVALNWTPSNFSSNPACNVTRNGTLVLSATCTNNQSCASVNTTPDGLYYWNVTCSDGSNSNISQTWQFRVDTAPPTVAIQSPANATYNSSPINLNFTSSDSGVGASSCWYSLDGASNISLPGCGNTSFFVAEGSHGIIIYSNDTLNNAGSAVAYFSVNLPPILGYTANNEQNSAFLNRSWAYFEISYAEGERANTTLNLNGTIYEMNCNATYCWYTATGLGGYYAYNITMNDSGGLANTTPARNLTVDADAPSVSIQSPANATHNVASVDLNFTVSDSGSEASSCWYSLDGGANTSLPGCGNSTLGNLTRGGHALFVYANDTVNNIGSANVSFRIKIGPDFDYTSDSEPDNAYLSRGWAYIEISYNESDRQNTTLDFNGTIYEMGCNSTHCFYNATGLADGAYQYNATMNNSGGYSTTGANRTLTIDTINPGIAINSPASSSVLNSSMITVNLSVNDTNMVYTNNSAFNSTGGIPNSTINATSGTYAVQFWLPDGVYNLTATAHDLAGNSNSTATTNILVDSVPPSVSIQSPANGTYNAASVALNFMVSDSLSGINKCWYTLDGGNATNIPGCANITIAPGSDGPHSVAVYANDSAGNSNSASVAFAFNSLKTSIIMIIRNQDMRPAYISGITLDSDHVEFSPALYFPSGSRQIMAFGMTKALCNYSGQLIYLNNVTLHYGTGALSGLTQSGNVPLVAKCR
ncbi:Right handed beta helix region [uncultured archaeon]|nr:Right handed beta helix region [uncultured archaeon]